MAICVRFVVQKRKIRQVSKGGGQQFMVHLQ